MFDFWQINRLVDFPIDRVKVGSLVVSANAASSSLLVCLLLARSLMTQTTVAGAKTSCFIPGEVLGGLGLSQDATIDVDR